jgi:hypothetical protein
VRCEMRKGKCSKLGAETVWNGCVSGVKGRLGVPFNEIG